MTLAAASSPRHRVDRGLWSDIAGAARDALTELAAALPGRVSRRRPTRRGPTGRRWTAPAPDAYRRSLTPAGAAWLA